jgi:SAM-dependent methyltransferase
MSTSDNPHSDSKADEFEHDDRVLFDSIADEYAKKDYAKSSSMVRRYQLFFALRPIIERVFKFETIVEIACGVGASAHYLDGLYEKYIGIDYSEKQIAAARKFNENNPRATFIAANIKSSVLPDVKADLILAVGALHHMTEHEKVFAALGRLAKPGGYFVAIEPHRGNALIQLLRGARIKLDEGYSKRQQYYLAADLRGILKKAGLEEIEIENEGYFSAPFAQVVIQPQFISTPISAILLTLDRFLDKNMPSFLKKLSWNIMARGKFPEGR